MLRRKFKGIWIPAEIWLNSEIGSREKLFLAEIDSLDNGGGCYASNSYFAKFFSVSSGRCSQVIKSLEAKGLISIRYEKSGKRINKRFISVVSFLTPRLENAEIPWLENDDVITKSIYSKLPTTKKSDKMTFMKSGNVDGNVFLDMAVKFHVQALNDPELDGFTYHLKNAEDRSASVNLKGAQELYLLHTRDGESIADINKMLELIPKDNGYGTWSGWKRQIISLSGIRKKGGNGQTKYMNAKNSLFASSSTNLVSEEEARKLFLRNGGGGKFSDMFEWVESENSYRVK